MKAFKVGDYVVNEVGSVGLISEVMTIDYIGMWYKGGRAICGMNISKGALLRYPKRSEIVLQLPSHMMESALRWLTETTQKYNVGDVVLSMSGGVVGIIDSYEEGIYTGKWYKDREYYTMMHCEERIIKGKASGWERYKHLTFELYRQLREVDCGDRRKWEEEVAMTTIAVAVEPKVLVSRTEKEALDKCSEYHGGESPSQLAHWFVDNVDGFLDVYVPLRGMGIAKFIDAMTNGYEVEVPDLVVGDRVVYIGTGEGFEGIGKVTSTDGMFTHKVAVTGEYHRAFPYNLRLATEEELKWDALGRKVGEFRIGDRYKMNSGNWQEVYGEWSMGQAKHRYDRGEVVGFYPGSTFVDFTKGGNA